LLEITTCAVGAVDQWEVLCGTDAVLADTAPAVSASGL